MSALLDARSRNDAREAGGIDGVVSEAFHYLEWDLLEALRLSFEKRLNCESPHDETIEDWRKVLVRCAPKCVASHRLTQWRPISLTNALSKWYLSCVTYLLRVYMSKPTASLLGFEPGRQCMGNIGVHSPTPCEGTRVGTASARGEGRCSQSF